MSLEFVNRLLAQLPAYSEAEVTWVGGTFRLMARGLPGPDRQLTNLTHGTEMFLPLLANVGITRIELRPIFIELID
jgi:hypothetical protein